MSLETMCSPLKSWKEGGRFRKVQLRTRMIGLFHAACVSGYEKSHADIFTAKSLALQCNGSTRLVCNELCGL